MRRDFSLIVTCEHGGTRIPRRFISCLRGKKSDLASHRGYDPGALEYAQTLSRRLGARLFFSTISRLLIDMNRSPGHRHLFSHSVRILGSAERDFILKRYYFPYREPIEAYIASCIRNRKKVLHIAVHTFTPLWKGKPRDTDIGILYDPWRTGEKLFSMKWQRCIRRVDAGLRVRRNFPYQGRTDGLTTYLRKHFPGKDYLGIELEISQEISFTGERKKKEAVLDQIIRGFIQSLRT